MSQLRNKSTWLYEHATLLGIILACASFISYVCAYHFFGGQWLSYNPDTLKEWNSALTGTFDDWHPAIHQLIFFYIPSFLWRTYAVSALAHQLFLSAAFSYLFVVMIRYHFARWALFCYVIIAVFGPQTFIAAKLPQKDTALAIFLVVLTAQTIQSICTRGTWLRQFPNSYAMAGVIALATLTRHNGFFYTVPFLVMLLFNYSRASWKVVISSLAFIALIKGPIYAAFSVREPHPDYTHEYKFIEACGLPISMMGSVYVLTPEKVPPTSRALLESIAPLDKWENEFDGTFNSIKKEIHGYGNLKVPSYGDFFADFLVMLYGSGGVMLRNFCHVTSMVIKPFGCHYRGSSLVCKKAPPGALKGHPMVADLLGYCIYPFRNNFTGIALWSFVVGLIYAIRKRMFKVVSLCVLPLIAYDLGTMLFLSGADIRFFYFNSTIFIPILASIKLCGNSDLEHSCTELSIGKSGGRR